MQTIGEAIRTILPSGTKVVDPSAPLSSPTFDCCPIFPPDVFAIAGKLVELSGAYHHILPKAGQRPATSVIARLVPITDEDVAWAKTNASAWRSKQATNPVPPAVEKEWKALRRHEGDKLFHMQRADEAPPRWWKHAIRLLMVSDQASVGIGFDLPPASGAVPLGHATASWVDLLWRDLAPPEDPTATAGTLRHARTRGIYTYSSADPNVVCVLPKVRTAGVGCSLRSLTHNLALLPPQGIARIWWLEATEPAPTTSRPLNLVVIPYPYAISAQSFREGPRNEKHGWGWFELEQRWLTPSGVSHSNATDDIVTFLVSVVEAAAQDVGVVHGVVLPEFALDYDIFVKFSNALARSRVAEAIEFLICGTSGNVARKGNFVCTTTYGREPDGAGGFRILALSDDRQKHHRWRLDRYQISRYGLTSALDPALLWWEDLPILSRSISMQQIRAGSVFTSMICEDLARADPCQEALRSLGPNLVFALLMDGPQLRSRWPGRYASILAEDPGSSVLTLSSMGLINRANESGTDPESHVIALWKDIDIDRREISIARDAWGVCLTLNMREIEEFTLDGRSDGITAPVWSLGSVRQISRDGIRAPAWINQCR